MPYKDKETAKNYAKEAMKKHRKGITEQGITAEGITPDGTYFKDGVEYVGPSYVEGLNGKMYEFLPERPRYLKLPDGQVFDRTYQPIHTPLSDAQIQAIRTSNENLFNYRPNKGVLSKELRARIGG